MYRSFHIPAAALLAGALFLPACGASDAETTSDVVPDSAVASDIATPDPTPTVASGPTTNLPPNELGEIMVLEYHRLGEPQGEFYRSAENFKADLETLYNAGFRPITVAQMLDGDFDIPAGTSPVVFTFDDSTLGQFYYLEDGSIDPNTMVGMWETFRADHPDWSGGATWCVLPAADHPSNFFGEKASREVERSEREARIHQKVDFLVSHGHEICNHTLYHARLDRAKDDAQAQEWIGRGADSIRVYLPEGYRMRTIGLPLGQWPKNRRLAWEGDYKGSAYNYEAVLEVAGGPNVSPFDREFDAHSIDRTIVTPGEIDRRLTSYTRDPGLQFVSDGVPKRITVPASKRDRVADSRWTGFEVVVAEDSSAADGASVPATDG